jgi:hypothetical protein
MVYVLLNQNRPFGILCGLLLYFMANFVGSFVIFSPLFGIMYQEKSVKP